ncbi:hypothetical protein N0752_24415 [Pseudomonas aeruginosa]|nr:hypothetical protein [Pseudomonas aeruginosa]MCS8825736.1 hypothetical protein [Pseudomonas aeruginosa]MCS8876618.1 hypothetical protein [Pseudomonas aeruginosa]MCS8908186.1 hypothetical protein [Pseudomonas aeruginosa]MCS8914237.1 hypothetical protein [Pseudomonas aeruginosa]
MNKAQNECTCPSGDGSLRWPCPAHPAVEQAGTNVGHGHVFPRADGVKMRCGGPALCSECAADAYRARAALAQPSPDHAVQAHDIPMLIASEHANPDYAMGWNDCRAKIIGASSAVQAEQAEAERPEVFGLERYRVERTGQGFWPYCVRAGDGTRELFVGHLKQCKRVAAQLATAFEDGKFVAGALRAENTKLSEALDECDGDRWKLRSERDAANARLHEVATACATAEQQRDAALARVAELESKLAELEKQEPVAWGAFHFGGKRDGKLYTHCETEAQIEAYILDMHRSSDSLTLRKGPLYGAPVAQAQHSVPEGWMLVECGIWTQEQVDEMQKTVTRFRNSEFVDDRALAMAVADAGQCKAPEISLAELLATAPGKEVPQAWIDVQAERRRQITAEGWTPEHDDLYCAAELPRAAAAYILNGANDEAPAIWPFVAKWWKPRDARSNYVRASALILAEIERLDRAAATQGGPRDA